MTSDPNCVYIVAGLPRSGTSLMMQMLAAGGLETLTDGVRSADEDNPRGYFEYEPVKGTRDEAGWLDAARGKVVKMVHILLYDLPRDRSYRVILMRRDVREIVASQARMLERLGRPGAGLPRETLIAAFEKQIADAEVWLEQQPGFECLPASYNELMREPAAIVERIDAFVGGGLETTRMLEAIDPSLYRQRVT